MISFERFKEDEFRKNPKLRRSSEAFLRQMYASQVYGLTKEQMQAEEAGVIQRALLTTETPARRQCMS